MLFLKNINPQKIKDFYYINTLIFVSIYIIILTYLLGNFEFFEFVNNSPDKIKFVEKINILKQYDLLSIFLNGKYTLPIQINILFQIKYFYIAQIILLYISIISIGYLLNYYFSVTKYLSLLILFIPSFAYILLLNLKDFYLFIAIANAIIILHYSKSINFKVLSKNNIYKIIFLFLFILINTYFFYFTRIYVFYLLLIFTFVLFTFNFIINNNKYDFNLIISLSIYLIIIIVFNIIFKTEVESTPLIFFEGEFFPVSSNFQWQNTKYLPSFIDQIIGSVSKLRYANIEHNIKVEARTLFTENIIPKNFLEFFYNLPYLIFKSLFPFKISYIDQSSIALYLVSIIEQIGIMIFLITFFIYKKKTSYSYFFLFIFLIFLFLYSYTNPNVGSLLRYKSVFQIPFFLISMIYILRIFKNLFFLEQKDNEFNNNIVVIFTLFLSVFLFLVRDIIIINSEINLNTLEFVVKFLIILSLVSNLIISPSITTLNSIKNYKIYKYIIVTFLILSFILLIILLITFTLISNYYFRGQFNNEIIYSLLIFFSIPLNIVLASMLMKKNKNIYIFSLNLIVPVITIMFFIFFKSSTNYLFEILFLSTFAYSLMMTVFIPLNFNQTNLKYILIKKKRIINRFLFRLNSKIILQFNLFIFLFLIFIYNILNKENILITYFLMKFIMLFISMFNIFIAYNITKDTKNVFMLKNYFFINTFVSILLIFIIILFKPFLYLVLGNKFLDNMSVNEVIYTFILMPCLIYNVLILKNIMNFNIQNSYIFKSFFMLLITAVLISLFFDQYLLKIIVLFFSIIFLNYFFVSKVSSLNFFYYIIISLSFLFINYSNIKVLLEKQDIELIFFNILIIITVYILNIKIINKSGIT